MYSQLHSYIIPDNCRRLSWEEQKSISLSRVNLSTSYIFLIRDSDKITNQFYLLTTKNLGRNLTWVR